MTFKYVAKNGRVVDMPYQAKNAMDSVIKANDAVKKKVQSERKDLIWQTVDKWLYDIKGGAISMGKLPRKK